MPVAVESNSATQRPAIRKLRVLQLAVSGLVLALLLFGMYGRKPDTATLQILGHAIAAPAGTDSSFYMRMGEDAFRTGDHRIFAHLFFEQHQKYIYPPSSLFLTELLDGAARGHLTEEHLRKFALTAAWCLTLVMCGVFYRRLAVGSKWLETACAILLGVLFLPIAESFYRGQVQLLLTLLWFLAAWLWTKQRRELTGVVLAITCAFKPQLAVFLLWGLLRRQYRFTAAFALAAGAILCASLLHFGMRNNLDYLPVLSYLSHHGEALAANQSVNGLMNRVLRNGDAIGWRATVYPPFSTAVYLVSMATSALLVAAALFLPLLRQWKSSLADFLFCGCACVLASPIAWEHHYGYFFPAILFLLTRSGVMTKLQWLMLAACTLAMSNRLPPLDHRLQGPSAIFGAYLLYAGVALLILLGLQSPTPDDSSAVA